MIQFSRSLPDMVGDEFIIKAQWNFFQSNDYMFVNIQIHSNTEMKCSYNMFNACEIGY